MPNLYIRFAARPDILRRSPVLERLIARASDAVRVQDWRADAFGLLAPQGTAMPSIAAMALREWAGAGREPGSDVASGGGTESGSRWACLATPVRLSAGMSNVTFPADGILALQSADAAALAADFNAVFDGAGVQLTVVRSVHLACVFDQPMDVATHDPEAAVGGDVFDFQPSGRDAPRLRRLTSEIEMWLFDHPVNRLRTAQGRPPISGLWLWGGGALGSGIPEMPLWAAGQDVFFAGFGEATEIPRSASSGELRAGELRSGVVVSGEVPGSIAWTDIEKRWLEPAAAELKSGGLRRVHLSGADRRITVTGGVNVRFWRRARPWWESFDVTGIA